MSKIGTQCQHSNFLNNSTISRAIEHMTILSWSLEPALPAHLVPMKIHSFPTEIFTLQPRHPFYSSLWSLQHFWCITLPSPQTMAILCLRDSLYPSSQALSGTSHPILLHQFHLFSVSTFFFSACHQECSLVVSDLLSGLKGLIVARELVDKCLNIIFSLYSCSLLIQSFQIGFGFKRGK